MDFVYKSDILSFLYHPFYMPFTSLLTKSSSIASLAPSPLSPRHLPRTPLHRRHKRKTAVRTHTIPLFLLIHDNRLNSRTLHTSNPSLFRRPIRLPYTRNPRPLPRHLQREPPQAPLTGRCTMPGRSRPRHPVRSLGEDQEKPGFETDGAAAYPFRAWHTPTVFLEDEG